MSSESNRNDEIDLMLIFSKIKELFIKLGHFIVSIYCIILSRWKLLFIFSIIGVSIGIGCFYYIRPVYISTLIVSSSVLSNDFCSDIIESMEKVVKDNTPDLLAKRLNISVHTAEQIKKLEFQNYDERLKDIYKDKDTVVLGRPFKIIVHSYSNEIFDTLQIALVNHLENNEYALKRKKIKIDNIKSMQEELKSEMHQLDSLKIKVSTNLLPRGNTSGFVFGQPIDPVNIYREGIAYFQKELDLNTELSLSDNIQVIRGFSPREKPDSPRFLRTTSTGGCAGFLFGLLYILIIEKRKKD